MNKLSQLKVGDVVIRMLAGTLSMELKVSDITHDLIYCGPWTFDRDTGAEIDEDLGWDNNNTGSYIKLKNE